MEELGAGERSKAGQRKAQEGPGSVLERGLRREPWSKSQPGKNLLQQRATPERLWLLAGQTQGKEELVSLPSLGYHPALLTEASSRAASEEHEVLLWDNRRAARAHLSWKEPAGAKHQLEAPWQSRAGRAQRPALPPCLCKHLAPSRTAARARELAEQRGAGLVLSTSQTHEGRQQRQGHCSPNRACAR